MLKTLRAVFFVVAVYWLPVTFVAAQPISLPQRVLVLEREMRVNLSARAGAGNYQSELEQWNQLSAELKANPQLLTDELDLIRGKLNDNLESRASRDEYVKLLAELNDLLDLQLRMGLSVPDPAILQFRPKVQPVETAISKPKPEKKPENFEKRSIATGDLVLTPQKTVGRVVFRAWNRALVKLEGGVQFEYRPRDLMKEAREPVNGVSVGSLVYAEDTGWGEVVRVWEDGHIEVDGKWYAAGMIYHTRDFTEVRAPAPKKASGFQVVTGGFATMCDVLLRATRAH